MPPYVLRVRQKLDPAVMLVSCVQAGMLLARLGRPEAMNCIAGLEQYSYSYEEAGDQAAEMKRIYQNSRDLDFSHMLSVVSRPPSDTHAMIVDDHIVRSNGNAVVQVVRSLSFEEMKLTYDL
jgi:hypothetical protein